MVKKERAPQFVGGVEHHWCDICTLWMPLDHFPCDGQKKFPKTSCVVCGKKPPEVTLVWHHRDPSTKIMNVSTMIIGYYKDDEKIWEEIEKCDVLCTKCHYKAHLLLDMKCALAEGIITKRELAIFAANA